MSDYGGKWLKMEDYALASGRDEAELMKAAESGELVAKRVGGALYLWAGTSAPPPARTEEAGGPGEPALEGESVLSLFTGEQELAMQAERAISLVDRSLATFMMMHREVVEAKDRLVEEVKDGFRESEADLEMKNRRIAELENEIKEKEQQIADMKMLIEILEGQRAREKQQARPEYQERATVGDMMQDQLRYVMEDQMIKDLLKE